MIHSTASFLGIAALYLAALVLILTGQRSWMRFMLVLGTLLNALFLVKHSVLCGVFIGNSLLDPVFFLPFAVSLILAVIAGPQFDEKPPFFCAVLLLLAMVLFAVSYPKGIIPPAANKSGSSPFLFFLTENIAYAFFGLAGAMSLCSVDNEKRIRLFRKLTILGFIIFSIAQVVGAYWSFIGWGHPFMWGARHLSSAAVWLFFAALIHMRFLGRFTIPERWMNVIGGFIAMFVVYSHLVMEMGIHRIGVK